MKSTNIRKTFSALAAIAAFFVATSASAALLATNDFEEAAVADLTGFTAAGDESLADIVGLAGYDNDKPSGAYTTEPWPFSSANFGLQYLSVDSGTNMVWRSIAGSQSKVYFDSYMKFAPTTGDVEYPDGSKFVIYLDAATSNLCVVSGTDANTRTPVTNRLTATVLPDTWGRLTVSAESDGDVFSFQVRLNGDLLATAGSASTFYSLASGATISQVGFKGTGAVDDMVVRTTPPVFGGSVAATIGGEDFATLEAAIAAAGADDVVVLNANNAENITLAEEQTFKLKPNGFTYSGEVTSANGCRIKLSTPDANGVVTYSQAPACKPSININFTHDSGNLTTADDVGLTGYEVPGTSWNNFAGANGTYSTVNAVDSNGVASVMPGVSVVVSGSRGSYRCSGLTAASNPLQGYIDENANNMTPTVTVTGIPYYKYRVVVYHSTDTGNVPFGYDTINGTNYTYENDAIAEGTTAWGNSGADDSANAIAEGGNVLLTGELSGSTLTVVGHRAGGASDARGCIAAIQIIEVRPEITENDLEIPVSGATAYTVDTAKTLSGTVYLTGNGTLTLDGSAKITAATIDVGLNVTLNVNTDRLDCTTFTGAGTVVYDGTKPAEGKGWTYVENWSGTVWVKNIPTTSNERTDWDLALYGNANSTLRFTNVNLYFPNSTTTAFPGTVDIDGEGMNVCDGYGSTIATISRLTGSGTLSTTGGSYYGNGLTINDASAFTGTITLTKYKVIIGTSTGTSASGVLQIESGKSITVAGATAPGGFVVNGTLVANGTLASSASAAVTGSGTVVFGGVPSPTGNTWWKNASWTGTVEIKGVTTLNGDDYVFNDYGNSGSTIKLTNCKGWLKPDYACVPALEIGGTFTWNDGASGLNNTFKVGTLKGSGKISIPNQGAETAVWQITNDWSQFTGFVEGNNSGAKRVLVFGATLPASVVKGGIYVSAGATLDLDNSSSAWWGVGMGFVVDGTVKASARSKWGGGTYMTLNDTGVLELVTGSSAVNDIDVSYSNVSGTGTVRYTGSNWRSLPNGGNMFATTLSIELENNTGVVFHGGTESGSTGTIGGLSGTKNLRDDLGAYNKVLTVKQAKDGVWTGSILGGDDRLAELIVDSGTSTTGTLTVAGTHTHDNKLTVKGSVNLTGTWVGNVEVEGSFGGTGGTVTGDLTFSNGAKLGTTGLTVTGDITIGENVEVHLPAGTTGGVTLLSSTGGELTTSTETFTVYVGETLNTRMKVKKVGNNALKVVSTGAIINIF